MDGDPVAPRWRRRLLRALFALVGLWLVAAGALVVLGVRAGERGRDELTAIEHRIDVADVLAGDRDVLRAARQQFADADRRLSHPLVRPLRVVPVLGRQLRAASGIASSTSDLLGAGQRAVDAVADAVEDGIGTGAERLELLDQVQAELAQLAAEVDGVDLGPDDALVGPLDRARREAARRIDDLRTGLHDAAAVLHAIDEILTGPTDYLVLAANNAEMRTGSGMFLSIGRVHFADGSITVDEFRPATELQLVDPVPLPHQIERLWGWAGPGREWRSLGLTPRFPVNASLAAAMWEAGGGEPVDGVLALDVLGLQHLLRATGPVTVGGARVSADGVVPLLLREQYIGIDSDDDNAARREQLSGVAHAVVAELGSGGFDAGDLADALRSAQRGRHLLLWSSEREAQRAWELAGASGELDARSLAVGVANIGGNKLDPFLDVTGRLDAERAAGGMVDVALEVEVRNETPAGQPDYVLGGDPSGGYRGVVVGWLPGEARDVAVSGGAVLASGPDGPGETVGVGIDVPRGGEARVRIEFALPGAAATRIQLVPSARVPRIDWEVFGRPVDDRRQRLDLAPPPPRR